VLPDPAGAQRQLAEVAAFFRRTEPHSPVSYLVQRAVQWGHMPLESWLRDVIKDETVLAQLRDTLGLKDADPATQPDQDANN
jgi:type VI secretion system protein ImpA